MKDHHRRGVRRTGLAVGVVLASAWTFIMLTGLADLDSHGTEWPWIVLGLILGPPVLIAVPYGLARLVEWVWEGWVPEGGSDEEVAGR